MNRWLDRLPYYRQRALLAQREADDVASSLVGHWLLDLGMRRSGVPEFRLSDVRFPARGRPRYDGGPDFSIAHAGDAIACAIGRHVRVGLDIERRGHARRPERLARWTALEAVIKADGVGLSGLAEVVLEGETAQLRGRSWHLARLELAGDLVATLATDRGNVAIDIHWIEDLLA